MQHGRQQQPSSFNRQTNVTNSRPMINSTSGHVPHTRPSHPVSAQSGQHIMIQQPYIVNYAYDPRHPYGSEPMFYSYPTGVIVGQQQRPSGAHHLQAQIASSMANMAGAGGAPIHQGGAHQSTLATISPLNAQSSPHPIQPIYAPQMPPKVEITKRQRNPLRIVNPNTMEEVVLNDTSSSSSNTHSAALKVEAPPQAPQTAQQTANNQTTTESSDASVGAFSVAEHLDQGAGADQNYSIEANASSIEEPPHTPVVSANADGPSVDITPKQAKNVKRK